GWWARRTKPPNSSNVSSQRRARDDMQTPSCEADYAAASIAPGGWVSSESGFPQDEGGRKPVPDPSPLALPSARNLAPCRNIPPSFRLRSAFLPPGRGKEKASSDALPCST